MSGDYELRLAALAQRIDHLEAKSRRLARQVRGMKLFVGGGIACGVLMLGIGQTRPATQPSPSALEAQRFLVRDAAGRDRAAFGMRDDGTVGLSFLDEQGAKRLEMMLKDGWPVVWMLDSDGRPYVWLSRQPGESGDVVSEFHLQGRSASAAMEVRHGKAYVTLGKMFNGAILAAEPETGAYLMLNQGQDNRIGQLAAGIRKEGCKPFVMACQEGKRGFFLETPEDGPQLLFKDKDGKTIWTAPPADK